MGGRIPPHFKPVVFLHIWNWDSLCLLRDPLSQPGKGVARFCSQWKLFHWWFDRFLRDFLLLLWFLVDLAFWIWEGDLSRATNLMLTATSSLLSRLQIWVPICGVFFLLCSFRVSMFPNQICGFFLRVLEYRLFFIFLINEFQRLS